MQWREKAWWEMPIRFDVLTHFILLCQLCFSTITDIFPNQIKNNHQNKHSRDCEDNLPPYTLPNFLHKEFIDNMGLDLIKWQDVTSPP